MTQAATESQAARSGVNSTSLAELKAQTSSLPAETQLSFFTAGGFALMQRGAALLSSSTLVPSAYRAEIEEKRYGKVVGMKKNPNAMPNCVLALNMSQRMGADPLMVMQNLYIVDGRPAWSSQFIIAAINACGKFSPLRFTIEELGEKEVEWITVKWVSNPNGGKDIPQDVQHKAKIMNRQCRAWAIEKSTGERLDGPVVSMDMAVVEGWFGKAGSKWQTMPEVMLRYRAASFFGKLYAPELLMGIQTAEEIHDTIDLSEMSPGAFGMDEPKPMTMDDIKASLPQADPGEHIDMSTGEVTQTEPVPDETPPTKSKAGKAQAHAHAAPGESTFPCPRKDNAPVPDEDCFYCPERDGCPSRA
ncbi:MULTISPECIES: hypothetical protein [unclassified Desulfovibrio]|uniref:hypothetical protein n=1 Tax=unclassified Desulfovibrio TaxID=2593640 RepID=UPI002FD98593